jgi:tRNA nucleotidyltransferase (CCA-adding enzyme)
VSVLLISFRFYNIQHETVEDFTGHGIQDLRAGLLRTPIDPVQTLRDDPLRALRAIRFM